MYNNGSVSNIYQSLCKASCRFFRCFSVTVFFILLSEPSHAIISPLGYELKDLSSASEKETRVYLQELEEWLTATGSNRLQRWLNARLALNTRSYYPLNLLGQNAFAIWWFIEQAFTHKALTRENKALRALVENLLQSREPQEQYDLLNTAIRIQGSTLLAELIVEKLGSSGFFESFPEYGSSLLFAALTSRNYRMAVSLLDAGVPVDSMTPAGLTLLQVVAGTPAYWQETSYSNAIYQEPGVPLVNLLQPGASASRANLDPAFTDLRRRLTLWTSQFPHELIYALEIARSARNEQAIEWLTAVQASQANSYTPILAFICCCLSIEIIEKWRR